MPSYLPCGLLVAAASPRLIMTESVADIRPFNEAPSFFGGGDTASSSSSDRIILTSLQRVKSLPALPKLRGLSGGATKALYKQLAGGTFRVTWVSSESGLWIKVYAVSSPDDAASGREDINTTSKSGGAAVPEPSSMRMSALKRELESYGVDCTSYLEKADLISALTDARKNKAKGQGGSNKDTSSDLIMVMNFSSDTFMGKPYLKFSWSTEGFKGEGFNKEFHSSVPREAKNVLANRLAHIFLRHCGSMVHPRSWTTELSQYFLDRYGTSQLPLSLDIAAIITDIYCSAGRGNRNDRRTGLALTKAGETLEAAGNWFAARDVYLLNADGPFSSSHAPHEHFMLVGFAGLATKRAADSITEGGKAAVMDLLYQAEELYIRAWADKVATQSGDLGDMNEKSYAIHLTNMMVLYNSICEKAPRDPNAMNFSDLSSATPGDMASQFGNGRLANEDEQMVFVMGALLFVAGLRNVDGMTHKLVVKRGPAQKQAMLKNEYHTLANVKRLFSVALRAPSDSSSSSARRHFRDTILEAFQGVVFLNGKDDVVHGEMNTAEDAQRTQQSAKEFLDNRIASDTEVINMTRCDGPGCGTFENEEGGKLRSCPCKAVYYCGTECQSKHWPKHKKSCSHHKKKMEQKKKQQQE